MKTTTYLTDTERHRLRRMADKPGGLKELAAAMKLAPATLASLIARLPVKRDSFDVARQWLRKERR